MKKYLLMAAISLCMSAMAIEKAAAQTTTTTTTKQKKGWSKKAKGAAIGAGTGAAVGAVAGKGKGAVIGGVAGAGAGYLIGRHKEKKHPSAKRVYKRKTVVTTK
jgi:uncharacterized protein YcfJ